MTLAQKLEKCARSIKAHVERGGGLNCNRGFELVDRYNALRAELRESDWKEWVRYCADNDHHYSHDGYDLFQ